MAGLSLEMTISETGIPNGSVPAGLILPPDSDMRLPSAHITISRSNDSTAPRFNDSPLLPMQWYYLSESYERIPVSEAQFAALAARGILRPATPVWRKGMADWTACGEVKPEIFTASVARTSDEHHPVTDSAAVRGTIIGLSRALAGYRPWL